MLTLNEQLGFAPEQRLLILSADRMGATHAATAAGLASLREGAATTATLMMPGAWARHAADQILGYSDLDIGVHLTLNAELEHFRWGPLTQSPSLLDGDGGFPRTVDDLWNHADLDEVRRECRAQVERAMSWGLDPTHLTTHLLALQQRPEFFDVLVDLAIETDLPIRLESADAEQAAGFPFRQLAYNEGLLSPDRFRLRTSNTRAHLESVLNNLPAGVTEVAFSPALAAEEIRAVDPQASSRFDDLAVLTESRLPERLEAMGVTLIGYRALRDAQRSARSH